MQLAKSFTRIALCGSLGVFLAVLLYRVTGMTFAPPMVIGYFLNVSAGVLAVMGMYVVIEYVVKFGMAVEPTKSGRRLASKQALRMVMIVIAIAILPLLLAIVAYLAAPIFGITPTVLNNYLGFVVGGCVVVGVTTFNKLTARK